MDYSLTKKRPHRFRADHDGIEAGIFKRNRALLRKTADYCAICGKPLCKELKFPNPMSTSIDHIIPVNKGGKSTMDNLQATHLMCNLKKGDKILSNTPPSKPPQNLPQWVDWSEYDG